MYLISGPLIEMQIIPLIWWKLFWWHFSMENMSFSILQSFPIGFPLYLQYDFFFKPVVREENPPWSSHCERPGFSCHILTSKWPLMWYTYSMLCNELIKCLCELLRLEFHLENVSINSRNLEETNYLLQINNSDLQVVFRGFLIMNA